MQLLHALQYDSFGLNAFIVYSFNHYKQLVHRTRQINQVTSIVRAINTMLNMKSINTP